jgi:flagellar biosynthetic protein FliQ
MTQQLVIEIASRTLYYTMIISAPILLTGLIVGLVVSIFQSVTQIKEMTFTFIPKIVSVMLIMLFTIPWMINKFTDFFNYILNIMMKLH